MRPNDRKYLKTHEWCKIENGVATDQWDAGDGWKATKA